MDQVDLDRATDEAAGAIQQRWSTIPSVGLILGTGLGGLADSIQSDELIEYDQVPNFPRSTAIGHRGRLVCGQLEQVPVIAMQGRCHLYEGYSWEQVTLPVRIMKALGVRSIVITNASGGLNPGFQSGDVMVMEDHIDLMFRSPPSWAVDSRNEQPVMTRAGRGPRSLYDPQVRAAALAAARRIGARAHAGTYVALTGPTYETRAEYRMLRTIGADAVGMSTVPEAIMATHLQLRILALSIITNVAAPDVLETVSGEEVVAAAEAAGSHVQQVIAEILPQLDHLATP